MSKGYAVDYSYQNTNQDTPLFRKTNEYTIYIKENCWGFINKRDFWSNGQQGESSAGGFTSYVSYWQPLTKGTSYIIPGAPNGSSMTIYPIKK